MDDSLSLLLRRLELDPPFFHAEEFRYGSDDCRRQLEATGVLRRIGAGGAASCPECGGDYRRVNFLEDKRTGKQRGYIVCPDCGLTEVPPEHLQRWVVDLPAFVHRVFSAASGLSVKPLESVEGRLWNVGRVKWAGRSREVWFGRAFRESQAAQLTAPLQSRPKAIVFAPTEGGAQSWHEATGNLVVALESTLSLDDGSFAFDTEYVEGRIIDAGLGPDTTSKRPARRRAERAAHIELLTREVTEILREMRDHAFATLDQTGQPELLPRPTQAELARRVGLASWDVSRCLNDSRARELRLYWEAAENLDQIMAWRGPVNRGRAS